MLIDKQTGQRPKKLKKIRILAFATAFLGWIEVSLPFAVCGFIPSPFLLLLLFILFVILGSGAYDLVNLLFNCYLFNGTEHAGEIYFQHTE